MDDLDDIIDDNLYILGFPFVYTPQLYYQIVKGLNKGTFKGINKGEFLNIASVKDPVNNTHYELVDLYNREDCSYNYWCNDNKKIKLRFLKELEKYTPNTVVVRDTVEPNIFREFISDKNIEPKAIVIDCDPEFVAKKLAEKNLYFPTNLVGYKEDEDKILNAVTMARNRYLRASNQMEGVKVVDILDALDDPLKPLRLAKELGFEIEDERMKNYLGNKVKKYKKEYKDVIEC